MTLRQWAQSRRRNLPAAIAGATLALALVVPLAAQAHNNTQCTYAIGTNGVGGAWWTAGLNHRHYVQTWHDPGNLWEVLYRLTDGTNGAYVLNQDNPTRWGGEIGYAKSSTANYDDNSGVTWTAQTTPTGCTGS